MTLKKFLYVLLFDFERKTRDVCPLINLCRNFNQIFFEFNFVEFHFLLQLFFRKELEHEFSLSFILFLIFFLTFSVVTTMR